MNETTDTSSELELEGGLATGEAQNKDDAEKIPKLDIEVSVERTGDVERKIVVAVSWEDVKRRLDEAFRELGQGVTIKGFRKGKVPRRMLEQLFGKHVTQEVSQRLVQDSLGRALLDEEIVPVSEPRVVDEGIREGEVFRYSAVMEVMPEIVPTDYFGVEVTVREATVTDEDVEMALRIKQREHTAYKTIEGRHTQAGDVLLVDLMGKIAGEVYDKEAELVELGPSAHETLPGLAAKLTDIAPDTEELKVELDLPLHQHAPGEPCPEGEATQHASLLVTIRDVKQKVVPELDDEFARDTGEAETMAALREKLRQQHLEKDEARAREEAKQELVRALVKRNNVPVVPALVERQLDQTIKMQLAMLGLEPDSRAIDEEALKERLRDDATETVQGALLLEAIAKKEKVEVEEADVEKRLAELAAARSQNVARVRSEYEKEGRLQALRGRLREDKTLDLLMSKANIHVGKKPTETEAEPPEAKPE